VPPCSDWATPAEVRLAAGLGNPPTDADLADAIDEASDYLFEMSGRIYAGDCSATVRVDRGWCAFGCQRVAPDTLVGPACSACGYHSTRLPLAGPPRQITSVTIDGALLDSSAYALEGSDLVRTDGAYWPRTGLVVAYRWGVDPPLLGRRAAAELAGELYKAANPAAGECSLPAGWTRRTAQGVTVERPAPASGLPGLAQRFLAAHNELGRSRRGAVWSPETKYPTRIA
jgi:hypothetical protein